jgi:hypothetical protein
VSNGSGPCGVCVHPNQEGDILCDLAWGGAEKARTCPLFELRLTKEEIKADFKDFLSTAKLHEIAAEYPDMAALLWVLQEEAPGREVEIPDNEDWQPTEPPPAEPPPTPPAPEVKLVIEVVEGIPVSMTEAEAIHHRHRVEVLGLERSRDAVQKELELSQSEVTALRTTLRTRFEAEAPALPTKSVGWWRLLWNHLGGRS